MRFIFFVLLLLLLPTPALHGQDEALEAFGEVIDVRVLNLEVAVTGEDGRHASGLRPEDFRLFVDDEEVTIEYFSEIREGSARAVAESGGTAAVPVPAVPSVTPGEVVGTSFLLFVDNFFGHARDRELVLEKLLDSLPDLGPRDRMAVVSFDGRRLDLLSNWSTSPATIAAALRAAMDQPAFGLHRRAELNFYETEMRTLGRGQVEEQVLNTTVEFIRKLSQQVKTVAQAATTAMRTMASPPGRKVLLMTSGGWPDDPNSYTVGPQDRVVRNRTLRFSPKQAFKDLAGTANLLGYTIYPIDLAGSEAFTRTGGRELEVELPMVALAEDTGGQAMINGFRETVMSRTLEDTGNYYWLGYTLERQRDDERHEVRVEVLSPGLEGRTRRGFHDLSRETEVTMMVESNLLFSLPLSGRSLAVEVGKARKSRRGKLELPVSLKIFLDEVVKLPVAGGFEARLELRVASIDAEGDRSEIPIIPVTLGGETPPPPGSYAIYETSLRLRKTSQRLALALYDLAGETIFSTSIDFEAPAS